jgi:hypothetical protein
MDKTDPEVTQIPRRPVIKELIRWIENSCMCDGPRKFNTARIVRARGDFSLVNHDKIVYADDGNDEIKDVEPVLSNLLILTQKSIMNDRKRDARRIILPILDVIKDMLRKEDEYETNVNKKESINDREIK